jgi:hypothetical protein
LAETHNSNEDKSFRFHFDEASVTITLLEGLDGKPVQHYLPKDDVPASHSELTIGRGDRPEVRLAIKLEPSEVLAALDRKWEILLEKDVRLPTLVSLLKAAHLTLFELIGYRYALSAAGHFMGWTVLGSFVRQFMTAERADVLQAAESHFPEFVNLVRPMQQAPPDITGTVSDSQFYICTGTPVAWAMMVFIRAGDQLHAVLVPVLEDAENAARFVGFLEASASRFEVRLAKFAGDRWDVSKTTRIIEWPEAKYHV